jgi:N-acetylneuraminate synthase
MEFTEPQWRELKQHADERKLLFLSSPFSVEAVEMLARIGVSVWKVASGEISNGPMLERILGTGKPVILSSGMSPWSQLDAAVKQVRRAGNDLTILQCTSVYPTPPETLGLNLLAELRARYGCKVGFSDHSGKVFAGLAAAALGADLVEVHITLSRDAFGPDVPASLTVAELQELVEGVQFIRDALNHPVDKDRVAREMEPMRRLFTRSIVARMNLRAGTVLRPEHLAFKKPGTGVPPGQADLLMGRRLAREIRADEMITVNDLVQPARRKGASPSARKLS